MSGVISIRLFPDIFIGISVVFAQLSLLIADLFKPVFRGARNTLDSLFPRVASISMAMVLTTFKCLVNHFFTRKSTWSLLSSCRFSASLRPFSVPSRVGILARHVPLPRDSYYSWVR